MPNVIDCLEQAKFLVSKGMGNEPAKLVMPRVEARKRRVNAEKRTRVQFDCDEECYKAFHTQLQRYREIAGNVTVAQNLITDVLGAVSDELIRSMAQQDEQERTEGSFDREICNAE